VGLSRLALGSLLLAGLLIPFAQETRKKEKNKTKHSRQSRLYMSFVFERLDGNAQNRRGGCRDELRASSLLLSFGKDWLKITRSSIVHVLLGLYATNTVTQCLRGSTSRPILGRVCKERIHTKRARGAEDTEACPLPLPPTLAHPFPCWSFDACRPPGRVPSPRLVAMHLLVSMLGGAGRLRGAPAALDQ